MKRLVFNVLLRGHGAGRSRGSRVVDRARPRREDVETCRRWLDARGVTCHPLEFGLACESTPESFERLFAVKVRPAGGGFELEGQPTPPAEIAPLIEQVTLERAPEMF